MDGNPETVDFHTSGSTGSPKTIRRTLASLKADASMLARAFHAELASRPVFVATVSPRHMYGCLWADLLPKAAGCACHPGRVDGWEALAAALARYSSVVLVTTPTFLSEILAQRDRATMPGSVAMAVTAGSLLRPETAVGTRELFGVMPTEIYGSTETGSVAWRRQEADSVWTLFDGVEACRTAEGAMAVTSPFCMDGQATLQDGVTFEGARRFCLHGRLDRIVKILEHPVVLPEIEDFFRTSPLLEDVHVPVSRGEVPRLFLLGVPSAEGREVLRREGYLGLTRRLRAFAAEHLPAYAVPRRMRFVRVLPYTAQGKLPAAEILPRFESPLQAPAVASWARTENRLEATFFCPADAVYFQGHFPGLPILPGVAQLTLVRAIIREAFGVLPDGTIRSLKFQKVVRPCETVRLTAERVAPDRVAFTLVTAAGTAASGTFTVTGEG